MAPRPLPARSRAYSEALGDIFDKLDKLPPEVVYEMCFSHDDPAKEKMLEAMNEQWAFMRVAIRDEA